MKYIEISCLLAKYFHYISTIFLFISSVFLVGAIPNSLRDDLPDVTSGRAKPSCATPRYNNIKKLKFKVKYNGNASKYIEINCLYTTYFYVYLLYFYLYHLFFWSGRLDSNQRPLEPHSSALNQTAPRPG